MRKAIAKGANRFFANIASELEYGLHFSIVASRLVPSKY